MMRVPELLVPAGGTAQLKAAVAAGADAVYLGGSAFNARAGAENFSDEELKEAIDYAHEYGVDVHVALNTLLYDEEVGEALAFAGKLYRYGADAVIVQDAGLAALIRKYIPDLALHISTQSTIYSSDGVREAERAGASRVILARELSLPEIKKICIEKGDMEIEIFAHGAICICLSGQCRMSGFIGGRSGNRGKCAQPCRMLYEICRDGNPVTKYGYQLSPKDMSLLNHIDEIAEAGVDSIKIEGRMKSAEYTAIVTSVYRKYLDAAARGEKIPREEYDLDMLKLRQIYSRGSFTDAYFKGSSSRELMSGSSPKNQGIRIGCMKSFDKNRRHAVIELEDSLSNGDGIEIRDGTKAAGNVVSYIRDLKTGRLVKTAAEGMIVEAGDLRTEGGIPGSGSCVYKITDKELMREAEAMAERHARLIPVKFTLEGAVGGKLTLRASAAGAESMAESPDVLEPAKGRAPSDNMLKKKLERTGGTPYECEDIDVRVEGGPFIPAALVNLLRRETLEELTEKRVESLHPADGAAIEENCRRFAADYRSSLEKHVNAGSSSAAESNMNAAERTIDSAEGTPYAAEKTAVDAGRTADAAEETMSAAEKTAAEEKGESPEGNDKGAPEIEIYFYDVPSAADRILSVLDAVSALPEEVRRRISVSVPAGLLVGEFTDPRIAEKIGASGVSAEAIVPAVTYDLSDFEIDVLLTGLRQLHDRGIIRALKAQNASHVYKAVRAGVPFSLDLNMNVLNAVSASCWAEQGMISAAVAEEPGAEDFFRFDRTNAACSITVYGRIPMMYTEHCPIGSIYYDPWRADDAEGRCCSTRHRYRYCQNGTWSIRSRSGAEYPLVSDSRKCRSVIYSSRPVDRLSDSDDFVSRGARILRICILDEDAKDIVQIINKIK